MIEFIETHSIGNGASITFISNKGMDIDIELQPKNRTLQVDSKSV